MVRVLNIEKLKSAVSVFATAAVVTSLAACSVDDMQNFDLSTVFSPDATTNASPVMEPPKTPSSIVVCISKKCSPAVSNMSKEFLFNAYLNLLENNKNTDVLMCDADSVTHSCYEPFVSFDIKSGITPATVVIDAARIIDVGMTKNSKVMEPVLDFSVYYNNVRVNCQPAPATAYVKDPNYMVINGEDFVCPFTAMGKSLMSMVLTVDYIDLDYGMIGAYYSAGVAGPAYGGGTGYLMLRFQNPVSPEILCEQKNEACAPFKPRLPEYDCCGGYGANTSLSIGVNIPGVTTEQARPCPSCTDAGKNITYGDGEPNKGGVVVQPIPQKPASK